MYWHWGKRDFVDKTFGWAKKRQQTINGNPSLTITSLFLNNTAFQSLTHISRSNKSSCSTTHQLSTEIKKKRNISWLWKKVYALEVVTKKYKLFLLRHRDESQELDTTLSLSIPKTSEDNFDVVVGRKLNQKLSSRNYKHWSDGSYIKVHTLFDEIQKSNALFKSLSNPEFLKRTNTGRMMTKWRLSL